MQVCFILNCNKLVAAAEVSRSGGSFLLGVQRPPNQQNNGRKYLKFKSSSQLKILNRDQYYRVFEGFEIVQGDRSEVVR